MLRLCWHWSHSIAETLLNLFYLCTRHCLFYINHKTACRGRFSGTTHLHNSSSTATTTITISSTVNLIEAWNVSFSDAKFVHLTILYIFCVVAICLLFLSKIWFTLRIRNQILGFSNGSLMALFVENPAFHLNFVWQFHSSSFRCVHFILFDLKSLYIWFFITNI